MKKYILVFVLLLLSVLTSCNYDLRTDENTSKILSDNLKIYLQNINFSQDYAKIIMYDSSKQSAPTIDKAYFKFNGNEQYSYQSDKLELFYVDHVLYVHDIAAKMKFKKTVILSGDSFILDYNEFVPKAIELVLNNDAINMNDAYRKVDSNYRFVYTSKVSNSESSQSNVTDLVAYFNKDKTISEVRVGLEEGNISTVYKLIDNDSLTLPEDISQYITNETLDINPYLFDLKMQ